MLLPSIRTKLSGEKQTKRVMQTLRERLVRVVPHGSKICLYEDDMFMAFIPEDLDPVGMTEIATMTIKEIAKPVTLISRAKIAVGVNVGFAANNEFSKDAVDMLQNVRIALENAAAQGVDLFSVYSRELAEQQTDEYKQYQEIRTAIAEKQFVLYYQPIYDIPSGKPVAYETLVRIPRYVNIIGGKVEEDGVPGAFPDEIDRFAGDVICQILIVPQRRCAAPHVADA